jgi:putative flippase GtrA
VTPQKQSFAQTRALLSGKGLKQLMRFGGVGILATLVHTLLALTLIKGFAFTATEANISAFFVATLVSYTLNALWSFEKGIATGSFMRFIIVGLISLAVIVWVSELIEKSGYPPELSVLIVACIIPVINFIIHKFWTFKA